ncbi:MAG: hypothetical protein K2Y33_05795 [Mycolicibacterium frederiksbergense]|nr:hypothetical protein [Mycolicibacterium frederiksbergense]
MTNEPSIIEIVVDGTPIHRFAAATVQTHEDRGSLTLEATRWIPEGLLIPPNIALSPLHVEPPEALLSHSMTIGTEYLCRKAGQRILPEPYPYFGRVACAELCAECNPTRKDQN